MRARTLIVAIAIVVVLVGAGLLGRRGFHALRVIAATSGPIPHPTMMQAPPGTAWPAAGWVPYTTGPLTVPVPPNPTYTADSAAIVKAMWTGKPNNLGLVQANPNDIPPSSGDFTQPLYFGHATDPVYTIRCSQFGGDCPMKGKQVHIPDGAYPAGGTDGHINIRDLTSGLDVELWQWCGAAQGCPAENSGPIPVKGGGNVTVSWGGYTPSNGPGINVVGGSASGISGLWGLRAVDLENNSINHALVFQVDGELYGHVYPAVGSDDKLYNRPAPWITTGGHLWLDVPPPYAADCPQYMVSILTAFNKYGGFMSDYGGVGGAIGLTTEGDQSYTYAGGPSPWAAFYQNNAMGTRGVQNLSTVDCGIDFTTHMHILNPPKR